MDGDLLRDGLTAGATGTAAMLCALGLLTELVPDRDFPPDYEVADAPTDAMATVLRRRPRNTLEYAAWRFALRWGYGSAYVP